VKNTSSGRFGCDGTPEVIGNATPGKDGSTVKKLIVLAMSIVFAIAMCISVTGCPSKEKEKSTPAAKSDGDKSSPK
jgi:hypothetical protein